MFGFIYQLKSIDKSVTEIYIGATWDMKTRVLRHKHRCNNKNSKEYYAPVYRYIREHGGFDNFEMTIIDSGECEDELELHCAEQFYIDMYGGIENLLNDRDALEDKQKRKEKKYIKTKQTRQRHIDNKDFYCKTCDIAAESQRDLDRHLNSISCKKKCNNLGNP